MAGIYIHVPFCRQRCTYCDFYFVTSRRGISEFVDRVRDEIRSTAAPLRTESVSTIYFGGGTPSRLPVDDLVEILQEVRLTFDVDTDVEVTIETNPEDLSSEYVAELESSGFNRLSIGVQSFDPPQLQLMNRAHTAEQAHKAVARAFQAGFDNMSVDLIFGLPGQSASHWTDALLTLIELGVPHFSTYGLTVEPRTVLAKKVDAGLVAAPNQDAMAETYLATIDLLEGRGYRHYEISSFAKPGFESRHNSAYWQHVNYVGFGPSAHSFWWSDVAIRWHNARSLRRYLDVEGDWSHIRETERLSVRELAEEHIYLGLRTGSGVDLSTMHRRFRHRFSKQGWVRIRDLVAEGLVEEQGAAIRLTPRGRLIADAIAVNLCEDGMVLPDH